MPQNRIGERHIDQPVSRRLGHIMLFSRFAVLSLMLAVGLASPALAERKVALLIGNSAYRSVQPLRNPSNDVALMARTLRDAGFDMVETALDLDERSLRQALRLFEETAADADVGVIFYSGHGIEMNGQNYLVPVDARLAFDGDVRDEAVPLDRVLESIDRVKGLRLIILDACRDNPFLASMKRTAAQRSVGRGLARAEPATTGTLIAYAARAGTTASDGTGPNSPFTAALARYVAVPGLDIRLALGAVRDEVLAATGQKQEPFVYGSLGGSMMTVGPATAGGPADVLRRPPSSLSAAPAHAQNDCVHAGTHWAQAEKADRTEIYEEHLRLFTNCPFASFARLKLAAQRSPPPSQVAAIPPDGRPSAVSPSSAAPTAREGLGLSDRELIRLVQLELQRVGCDPGSVNGTWSGATRSALTRFNTFAKTNVATRDVSFEALEVLRARDVRACPLVCAAGTRASGEQCIPIVCGAGQQLSARGVCVPTVHSAPKPAAAAKAETPAASPKPDEKPRSAAGAPGMYDDPQPGMSCTSSGLPGARAMQHSPVTGNAVIQRFWCK